MDYTTVKEWLDILVDRFKKATETSCLTSTIRASVSRDERILFYDGLEIVADIMGLKLTEEYVYSEYFNEYYYGYSFVYEGVTFWTSRRERLERFACRDREQNGC